MFDRTSPPNELEGNFFAGCLSLHGGSKIILGSQFLVIDSGHNIALGESGEISRAILQNEIKLESAFEIQVPCQILVNRISGDAKESLLRLKRSFHGVFMNALIVLGNNFGGNRGFFNRSPAGTLNSLGTAKNS